ncbi:hypothetical protein M3Y97_01101900 [Aphelenchoides bicaudatus]|nr:hypothetical protein M3Y97_01101900 [Aphelenchoides bicaudatus]
MKFACFGICVLFLLFATTSGVKHKRQHKKYAPHKRAVHKRSSVKENAFVRIHIQSRDIVQKATSIQQQLSRKDSQLRQYFQPPSSFHFTVLVTYVDNSNLNKAIQAVDTAVHKFKSEMFTPGDQFKLKVKGLQAFNKRRVLIATLEDNYDLENLNEYMMDEFKKHKLAAAHSAGHSINFHAHMSIVNIKDKSMECLGDNWQHMLNKNMHFGTETVKSIQLVRFGVNKQTRDYDVIHEVKF